MNILLNERISIPSINCFSVLVKLLQCMCMQDVLFEFVLRLQYCVDCCERYNKINFATTNKDRYCTKAFVKDNQQ